MKQEPFTDIEYSFRKKAAEKLVWNTLLRGDMFARPPFFMVKAVIATEIFDTRFRAYSCARTGHNAIALSYPRFENLDITHNIAPLDKSTVFFINNQYGKHHWRLRILEIPRKSSFFLGCTFALQRDMLEYGNCRKEMVVLKEVLIVMESEEFRLALWDALKHDCGVTMCGDAWAGIELLRRRPDALVLDLLLPGTDGLAFLKNACDLRPPIILMLTGFVTQDILQTASDLGVNYVFIKPCPISAVVAKLLDHLK